MKSVLHVGVMVLGFALIGLSVAILRTVDAELGLQTGKPRETIGLATQANAPMPRTRIDTRSAQRLTMLGASVGALGGINAMIGTVLIVATLLESKTMRSRLGTDLRA